MDYTYLEDKLPANVLAVLEDLDDHSWKIMMNFIDGLKSQVECRAGDLTQELEES